MSHNRDLSAAAAQLGFHNSNIGIGTDNPTNLLHVYGQARFEDYLRGTTANNKLFIIDDVAITATKKLYFDTGSNTYIDEVSADTLRFTTGGTERLRITSDGKMGLGTQTPGQTLSISGSSAGLGIYNTGNSHGNVYFYKDGTAKGWLKYRGNDDKLVIGNVTDAINVLSSGNVGVNCTPLSKFQVNTATNANIALTSDGSEAAIEAFNDAGSANVTLRLRGEDFKFFTSSTERLRITSAGQLLKSGQASLTSTSLNHPIQVAAASDANAIAIIGRASDDIGELSFYEADKSTKLGELQYRRDHLNFRHRVGDIRFATGGTTERLRIDSTGQLTLFESPGIQLSAKTSSLYAQDGSLSFYSTTNGVYLNGAGTNGWLRLNASGAENDQNSINIFGSTNARIEMRTSNVERLRIHSGGQVTIGKTSTSTNNDGVIIQKESNVIGRIDLTKSYSGTANAVACFHTSTYVGGIQYANSSVNFYNASDYRLKENVVNLEGAITRIKQLSPKRFNYIDEASNTVDGFLAHEAQTVVPEAVSGTHNEVDGNGDPVIQCIDQSKLVPLLTAALKEAIGKIETLEAAVTALQGS